MKKILDGIVYGVASVARALAITILALLAGYMLVAHFLGAFLVLTREGLKEGRRLRQWGAPVAGVVLLVVAGQGLLIALVHHFFGWWVAGPLAALAVYVVIADLRAPVKYTPPA